MVLNNSAFSLRKNLLEALQAFQKGRPACGIWVDAICINQDDDAEKSRQVREMDQIYREATSLFIWLGQSDTVSERFMSTMHFAAFRQADVRKSTVRSEGMTNVMQELDRKSRGSARNGLLAIIESAHATVQRHRVAPPVLEYVEAQ